jgi:hypothetical protein
MFLIAARKVLTDLQRATTFHLIPEAALERYVEFPTVDIATSTSPHGQTTGGYWQVQVDHTIHSGSV